MYAGKSEFMYDGKCRKWRYPDIGEPAAGEESSRGDQKH